MEPEDAHGPEFLSRMEGVVDTHDRLRGTKHEAIRRLGKASGSCVCCGGSGEHPNGYECYACDSSGAQEGAEKGTFCHRTCPCGMAVTHDPIDGWQHDDGSVSHDGEHYGKSVSDLMKTASTDDGVICRYPDDPSDLRKLSGANEFPEVADRRMDSRYITWSAHRHYASEERTNGWFGLQKLKSPGEAQEIADRIAGSGKVRVEHNPSYRYSFAQQHPHDPSKTRIVLSDHGMNHTTLLHELAHHAHRTEADRVTNVHGPEFKQHFADLAREHHPEHLMEPAFHHAFHQVDAELRGGKTDPQTGHPYTDLIVGSEHDEPRPERPEPLFHHYGNDHHDAEELLHSGNTYLKHLPGYEGNGDQWANYTDHQLSQGMPLGLVHPERLQSWLRQHPGRSGSRMMRTAARKGYVPHPDKVFWHGSPSGDMRGGHYGLHLGTHESARQALNARIGHPVEGHWDGTREYGKTLLAGKRTLHERGIDVTGYSVDAPEEDHYPTGSAGYMTGGGKVSMDAKPHIFPVRIKGEMSNTEDSPHEDFKANGYMKGQIKRGNARRGYFYTNDSEDEGSVSAVVPGPDHVERLPQHEIEPGATRYRPGEKKAAHTPLHEREAMGAQGDLPEDLRMEIGERGHRHRLEAYVPEHSRPIGYMEWMKHTGEVGMISVRHDYQRRGVANALWDHAHAHGPDPKPVHSRDKTGEGEGWASQREAARAWLKGIGDKQSAHDPHAHVRWGDGTYRSFRDAWGASHGNSYMIAGASAHLMGIGGYDHDDHEYRSGTASERLALAHHALHAIHRSKGSSEPLHHGTKSPAAKALKTGDEVRLPLTATTGMADMAQRYAGELDEDPGTVMHFPKGTPFYPHSEVSAADRKDYELDHRWDEAITAGHFRVGDTYAKDGLHHVHMEHLGTFNPHSKEWEQPRVTKSAAHPRLKERIFGPTRGSVDPRLFTGDKMKPEVRTAVLERLDAVLGPLVGFSWKQWSRVYLAGSEASEWYGNDDFDTLIGVFYELARQLEPGKLGKLSDVGITEAMNFALKFGYNASPWKAPFGGTWDLTGFVNPGSYDITKIKPYAAYNITDDVWAVRPPHLPDWDISKFPQGAALLAEAEAYASVIEAVDKMPEPFRTQQGVALWEHLHGDRGRAFSDQGEGWFDSGNVIEKALVEWGLWQKLVDMKYHSDPHARDTPAGWSNDPTVKTAIKVLPVEPGLYYRFHHKDAPFGPEHASSTNLHVPEGAQYDRYRQPKPGYSAFWHPEHLSQYLSDMGWDEADDAKDRRVIAFRGKPIGEGADGEPLVMPHSDKIERSMSLKRARDSSPEAGTRWDHHYWNDGPQGPQAEDDRQTLGEMFKDSAKTAASEPLANPYHGDGREGSRPEWGHTWFHGARNEPTFDKWGIREKDRPTRGMSGPQMNKLLGWHFTPLHEVAHHFAGHSTEPSSISHTRLRFDNPAHYESEEHLNRAMFRWAHKNFPGFHDEKQNENAAWDGVATSHKLVEDEREHSMGSVRAHRVNSGIQRYLQFHPQQPEIAKGFAEHLHMRGHLGITYGNNVEGPDYHVSAIATDPSQVEVMHQEKIAPWQAGQEDKWSGKIPEQRPDQITHEESGKDNESEQFMDKIRQENLGNFKSQYTPGVRPKRREEYHYQAKKTAKMTAEDVAHHRAHAYVDEQIGRHHDELEDEDEAPPWMHDDIKDRLDRFDRRWNIMPSGDRDTFHRNLHAESKKKLIVGLHNVHDVLNDGRMKTLKEVGNIKGNDYTRDRHAYERHVMGVPHDLPHRERPIYGSMHDDPEQNFYGRYKLELKPHVRRRTTVTMGDSLNDSLRNYSIDHVSHLKHEHVRAMTNPTELSALAEDGHPMGYMEFQVHGGVSLHDIAKLHMHGDLDSGDEAVAEHARAKGLEVVHHMPHVLDDIAPEHRHLFPHLTGGKTVRLDLGRGAYADYQPGMQSKDKITIIRPEGATETTWGALVAHSNGEILEQIPDSKTAGAKGDLPEGITYEHELKDGIHTLYARHPDMPGDKKFAGVLSWWDKDGEIGGIEVHPQMQRRGLATELHRRAKEMTPHLRHSESLSPDAKQWIKSLGGLEDYFGKQASSEIDLRTRKGKRKGISHTTISAHSGGRKVGHVRMTNDGREVDDLHVVPDMRGQGIAHTLMNEALRQFGHQTISLHASPFTQGKDKGGLDRDALMGFYASHGFEPYPDRGEGHMIRRPGSVDQSNSKTAMPAKRYPPPEGFSHEVHELNDPSDNDHAKQEQDWSGWNHKILYGKINGEHAGHIVYSENPHGTAISVGKMDTYNKHRNKGVASAMQDALTEEHPNHWINHGSRTGPGRSWWHSYDDPASDRNIHNHPHEAWEDDFAVPGGHDDPKQKFGDNERPPPPGGKKYKDLKGERGYIAGVVRWHGPEGHEDHGMVHDRDEDPETRADTLLNAAQGQGSLQHGRWHDDWDEAEVHAEGLGDEALKDHKGPITSFYLSKNEDDQIDGIKIHHHMPDDGKIRQFNWMNDVEDHWHPIHDKISRQAKIDLTTYYGMAA